jgi:hypothetical protein
MVKISRMRLAVAGAAVGVMATAGFAVPMFTSSANAAPLCVDVPLGLNPTYVGVTLLGNPAVGASLGTYPAGSACALANH